MALTESSVRARKPKRRFSLMLAALLLPLSTLDGPCGGARLQGNTYVAASCTSWAGFTWSAWTSNFVPNAKIKYKASVWYNGVHWWYTESGWYYTDSIGNHFQWPAGQISNSLECGSGTYLVEVWTQNEDNSWNTFSGSDEVACG